MKRLATDEQGIALFLVLWVLALLTVIVGEFVHAMRTELNITRNFKEQTQARYIAYAGLETAIAGLIRQQIAPPPANEQKAAEAETIHWRSHADIPWIDFGDGAFKVAIENESGKINLNAADARLLGLLVRGLGLEEDQKAIIIDSIQDWRDPDTAHRVNGAEDDYYQSLDLPYYAKDQPFDSVEELLWVRGVTPELFYSGLKQRATVWGDIPEAEKNRPEPSANSSQEKEKTGFDFKKVNLNAASDAVLAAFSEITEDEVAAILDFRAKTEFKNLGELVPLIGGESFAALRPFLTLEKAKIYTIRSRGKLTGSPVTEVLEAVVAIDEDFESGYWILKRARGPAFAYKERG